MDTFEIIHEIIRVAQITTLNNGIIQLVVTDGNKYHDSSILDIHDDNFKDKIIIDVVSMNGTDADVLDHCNKVTDFLIAYGITEHVVVQPSSEYSISSMEDYLRRCHNSGIAIEWIDGKIVTTVCSQYMTD
jgi:ribosomal protein S4E